MSKIYLYNNLKILRKRRGWTQDEMQSRCGVSRATWSNYENGNTEPDIQTLAKISFVFEVSIDDLILKNLANVDVIQKNLAGKRPGFVDVIVEPSVDANSEKDPNTGVSESFKLNRAESDLLGYWSIMGQLHIIDAKIDELRALADKPPPKEP